LIVIVSVMISRESMDARALVVVSWGEMCES
jgi:hypothetical protein